MEWHHVECQFTKPLMVGDEIEVCMWWDRHDVRDGRVISVDGVDNDVNKRDAVAVLFQRRRVKDNMILVDGGYEEIHCSWKRDRNIFDRRHFPGYHSFKTGDSRFD